MPNTRVTWLFNGSTLNQDESPGRAFGFSESWIDADNPIGSRAFTQAAFLYAQRRANLLPPQVRCIGWRAFDLDTHASTVTQRTIQGNTGLITDLPQLAMLRRIQALSDPNHFGFYLKCIPDDVVRGGEWARTSAAGRLYGTALVQFLQYVADTYAFRGIDLTVPRFEVDTIDSAGIIQLKETFTGISVGDAVQIRRTQLDANCCGAGGKFLVKALDGTSSFQIAGWLGRGTAHGGTVGLVSEEFNFAIAPPGSRAELAARPVIKKVGRPFELFRGRRSPTCCQCS